MAVAALLTQNGHGRPRAFGDVRCRHVFLRVKRHLWLKARVFPILPDIVLRLGAFRVIAPVHDAAANLAPLLCQVAPSFLVDAFTVAENLDFIVLVQAANNVTMGRQAFFAQFLQNRIALGHRHLDNGTGLFVEQGFQGNFVALHGHLFGPNFVIAPVGCIGVNREHVQIQRHAGVAGKRHFTNRGPQAAV